MPALAICRAAARAVRPDDPLPVMVGGSLADDEVLMTSLGASWAGTSLVAAAAFAGRLGERAAARASTEVPELP